MQEAQILDGRPQLGSGEVRALRDELDLDRLEAGDAARVREKQGQRPIELTHLFVDAFEHVSADAKVGIGEHLGQRARCLCTHRAHERRRLERGETPVKRDETRLRVEDAEVPPLLVALANFRDQQLDVVAQREELGEKRRRLALGGVEHLLDDARVRRRTEAAASIEPLPPLLRESAGDQSEP